MIEYSHYNRAELIALLHQKNRQIDSQRSMLYQSRVSRSVLRKKLKMFLKIKRANEKLHVEVDALSHQIGQMRVARQFKSMSMKEHAPVILNAITGLYKLRNKGEFTDNEVLFLLLGYQKKFFYLSDIPTFRYECGCGESRWKADFRACCGAGYFNYSETITNTYYYLSYHGRTRLESLLVQILKSKRLRRREQFAL